MSEEKLLEIRWGKRAHESASVQPVAIFGSLVVHATIGGDIGSLVITHLPTGYSVIDPFPIDADTTLIVKATERLAPYFEDMPELDDPNYMDWVFKTKPKVEEMYRTVCDGREWTDGA